MTNRFKGLDLIDRVTEELWTEVHDIIQEEGIKTIPKKKKCKKAIWLSEEVLQNAERSERQRRKAFHAKMGTIKDRNDMELTEQKRLRRGGKNTQKNNTKKFLMI